MQTPSELFEPLCFFIIEVQKQLQGLENYLETHDEDQAKRSLSRIDYIDNHQTNLNNRCSLYLIHQAQIGQQDSAQILAQSYQQLTHSLKELSRQLEKVAYRALNLKSFKLIQKQKLFQSLAILNTGLELLEPAIISDSSQSAIDICRLQVRIAKLCQNQIDKNQKRLKKGQQTQALLEACLITQDIKRLGDVLLRIGEAILSANLGQAIKLERYHSLEATLSALELNPDSPQFSISTMGETKSGCTISGVFSSDSEDDKLTAIFKEGQQHKLREEKAGIESWNKKFPGVAPEVYSYHKMGDKAALLFEYMTGETFDKLITQNDRTNLKKGLNRLFTLLLDIWQETVAEQPYPAHFMHQLKKRLKDIYRVHPDFDLRGFQLGEVKQASLESLIEHAQEIEDRLSQPNGVYIHGDFNVDNLIYDPIEKQISFIDLHRSEYSDYVQDLSVFMVSNYRITDFDPDVRKLISETMQAVYQFGESYAKQIGDDSYHLRMALALSRSFLSSTRFVLDKSHAKSMHYRGRYLLEQIVKLKSKKYPTYRISKELFRE
ncbi:MAG TPA: aminoglycoside phosphotransferase family protein [Thiomicrospira sp.]|nr:aminoglycoside phosphotransferase family protein [Thiomicrospira sp.]